MVLGKQSVLGIQKWIDTWTMFQRALLQILWILIILCDLKQELGMSGYRDSEWISPFPGLNLNGAVLACKIVATIGVHFLMEVMPDGELTIDIILGL